MKRFLLGVVLLLGLDLPAVVFPREFRAEPANTKITTGNWGPKRTKPVFTGPFQVDLVCIAFPDSVMPEPKIVQRDLNQIDGGACTIKAYYEDYSQQTTYPTLAAYPDVYVAPKPLGYYCRHDFFKNRIGWEDDDEGAVRVQKLRADALAFVQTKDKGFKKGAVTTYVYCTELDRAKVSLHLRTAYPKPKKPEERDLIDKYNPQIAWAEPLWPNSLPQVHWPSDGRTLFHELGHVLGAPDYYHASERCDGVPGAPSLPWGYGPTGMAYDRAYYQAFVPPSTYPVVREDGVYTLHPRSSRCARLTGGAEPTLGYFIPSSHPNYMFYVEYVHDEKRPVGSPDEEGLLIHVINVTFSSPMMGPPDLCYTYRRGDKFMKGEGRGEAYFRPGDEFTMKSDPAARIPPLLPGGIEITDIETKDGCCSFKLTFTHPKFTPKELKEALVPRIRLVDVTEVLPTSIRPICDIMYRGEPLMTEYGFTWDVKKNPTVQKNHFPLYHRDRYDARILDLKPGTTYYVRAYVKNVNGITYSKREIEVTTPTEVKEVPALLTDHILESTYITRWYFGIDLEDLYFHSANPIIALMSLGVYYGTMPGGIEKGKKPFDVRKVHTDPSASRPKFRMSAFEAYFKAMKTVAARSGLMEKRFDKMREWQTACAKELKIKDPKAVFVSAPDQAAFDAQKALVKSWIDQSQPVLLVRENRFMPDVTYEIYPLDIALIDGYDEEGAWHVTFPLGFDRGSKMGSAYLSSEEIYVSVTDALLMFYRP